MTVGRNDLCPCGSGKKYKKCCLKEKNIIQLTEHQREKFYQNKHSLVDKMRDFIVESVSFNDYHQLRSQFKKRLNSDMEEDTEDHLFHFWLNFFNQFENGKQGVEWFYHENEHRLDNEEKIMVEQWASLTPRLLQTVNQTSEAVIFQDVFTEEQFNVSNHEENLPQFIPWLSTVALVESFQDLYYFNGVRSYVGPDDLYRAKLKVTALMNEQDKSYENVMLEYYPEIIGALLTEERNELKVENELNEYTIKYEVKNMPVLLEFLRSEPELAIENWTAEEKVFGWFGNWRAYHDTELSEEVKLADVNGRIIITNHQLQFTSYDEQKIMQMKELLKELKKQISFVSENVTSLPSPGIQVQNTVVSIEKEKPQFYALYAQNAIINELNEPIPMFDHLSLREMKENNRLDELNIWLQQTEYNMYRIVLQEFGEVIVTADFNTVRKELGLALSPFVTGGADRETKYIPLEEPLQQNLTEDDIPILNKLGFTPNTADNFYMMDIINFYRKRTIDKSETTIRKYTISLSDLRELFERNTVSSWEACDADFWKKVLLVDYFKIVEEPSNTERKDFLSTVRMFLVWLDQDKKTKLFDEIVEWIKNDLN